MTDKKYISTKEAAELLGLSTRRIVGLCNKNSFEGAIQEGRNWKIPKSSVMNYGGFEVNEGSEYHTRVCAVGSTSYKEVVKSSYYVDNRKF